MNHRIARTLLWGALMLALAFGCGMTASRAPLGGDYSLPDSDAEPDRDRKEQTELPSEPSDSDPAPDDKPEPNAIAAIPVAADAGAPTLSADVLRYDPLKAGDQIKGELSISFSARADGDNQGALPGNGAIGVDSKFHIALKILKTSLSALDELELTLASDSMSMQIGGQSRDLPATPAKTFEVTLSGQSPSVREQGGAKLDAEERAVLMVLVTPLADFHEHWSRAPTLDLKPGWTGKAPISAPSFMGTSSDSMHIGPFVARYTGRDSNSDAVPFQVTLPIQYKTDLGKLDFDLSGTARLASKTARPVAIDLSGPISGSGTGELRVRGTAKLSATLSYL